MNTKKLKYNSIKILTNIINMCDTPPTSDAMQEITEITEITEIMMSELISSIPYIQKCSTNKNRDETSLSYLIDRHLSQSDCIKLGIAMENYFTGCICTFSSLVNIRPANSKGQKEKDILFMDDTRKQIYYTEVKNNLNLDTEKSRTTYEKCLKIREDLNLDDGYTINWCLLGARYTHSNEMPSKIQKKYTSIKDNLFGVNQFLEMYGINFTFTNETYKTLINNIANACFDDDV